MTLLRRNRIAAWTLLFVGVFLFGTVDASAQTNYYWIGGNTTPYSSWADGSNWSLALNGGPAGSFPDASTHIAVFQGSSSSHPEYSVALAANRSIGGLVVTNCDVKLSSSNVTLTVADVDITNGLLKLKYSSGSGSNPVLNITASLELDGVYDLLTTPGTPIIKEASIRPDGVILSDVHIALGVNAVVDMNEIKVCSIGTPSVTPNIRTAIGRSTNAFSTDVRFDGSISIVSGGLFLGNSNLYLGKYAEVFGVGTFGSNTDAFIHTDGDADSPMGTIRRQYDGPGQSFFYPVGPGATGDRYSPLLLTIDATQPNPNIFDYTTLPWPHISVRCLLNGNQGHPMNFQSSKIWVYWVVKGYGISEPVGLSGAMYLHNNYRSGDPDVYSARWTPPYEDFLGAIGFWDLTGSQAGNTTGSDRIVPFLSFPGFGDYNIGKGDPGDPVPVELTAFSARYVRDNVELSWQTATELNNYGFAIERSEDGDVWNEVDFVPGHGNSYSPKNYTYTDMLDDALRSRGQLSYRLRQVDRDGTTDYSNIVVVRTTPPPAGVHLHAAYPNPFNPATTLSFSLSEATPVRITVYSLLGRQIATLVDNALMDAGFHTVGFNGNELPSGAYVIELNAGGTLQRQRVVLSK